MPRRTSPLCRTLPIAVIADDKPLRESIGFSLAAEGYPVRAFETGDDLLAARELGEVSCFVIDQRPGIDVLAIMKRLEDAGAQGRAVVIATRPSLDLRDACWGLGVPIVEKPIFGETLNACIRGLLAARRAHA
jgi:FixJ family two-component response regulator